MERTVSAEEVARFGALAARWWDPRGPMAPLHRMNPLRAGWIDARLRRRFGAPGATAGQPPSSATGGRSAVSAGPGTPASGGEVSAAQAPEPVVLDVGCGAGLLSEALARQGWTVLGLDASAEAIAAARAHAAAAGLDAPAAAPGRGENRPGAVAYREGAAEDLLAEGARFPAIAALEVIEHVPDPGAFLRVLAGLLAPGGVLFVSTLNRTLRSLAVAKIGAEYVLRLLPAGTHDWRRFLTPAELAAQARGAGLRTTEAAGMRFDPLRNRWQESRDLSVNYIAAMTRD